VPHLIGMLESASLDLMDSDDLQMKREILEALGEIGPAAKGALPALERSLRGPLERETRDAIKKITGS
jgi:hypothetical protein